MDRVCSGAFVLLVAWAVRTDWDVRVCAGAVAEVPGAVLTADAVVPLRPGADGEVDGVAVCELVGVADSVCADA